MLRRSVQALSFVAFTVLAMAGGTSAGGLVPDGLFSRLDPLVALTATIASRTLVVTAAVSVITLIATVALGRVWCGWVCPLGTVLDLTPAPSPRRAPRIPRAWRLGKYATLAAVLLAAGVGILQPMVLDPVTVVARPLQELARPFLGADAVGRLVGSEIGREMMTSLALLTLVPLYFAAGLNGVSRRLWCRSLCPLGGLLAVTSKLPGLRRVTTDACSSCGRCARECPVGAIDAETFVADAAECTVCLRCKDVCHKDAVAFRLAVPSLPAFDASRRDTLATLGATGAAFAVSAIPAATALAAEEATLRPPGTSDRRLAALCIRCGACYGACPTDSIRPSVSISAPGGLWTPMLDQRPDWCTLNCNRCSRVCPTDAIHTLTFEEQVDYGVGTTAEVDRPRCRAWARGRPCMRCLERCPIHGALIGIDDPMGRRPGLQVPVIDPELCIGCGLCSTTCPERPIAIGMPNPAPRATFT